MDVSSQAKDEFVRKANEAMIFFVKDLMALEDEELFGQFLAGLEKQLLVKQIFKTMWKVGKSKSNK